MTQRRRHIALSGIGRRRGQGLRSEREDEELGALPARSVEEIDPLVSEIMSDTRSWAVVGLTSRRGEDRPGLSPFAVRAIVGPQVPVYLEAVGYHDKLTLSA